VPIADGFERDLLYIAIGLAVLGLFVVFSSARDSLWLRSGDQDRRRRQRAQQELHGGPVSLHDSYSFVAVFAVVSVALIAIEPVVVGGLLLMTLVGHLITVTPRQRPRDGRPGRGADLPGAQAVTATAGRPGALRARRVPRGERSIPRRGARPPASRPPVAGAHESGRRRGRSVRH
jgi:hypothetical protein